jgi:TPR repeat protein
MDAMIADEYFERFDHRAFDKLSKLKDPESIYKLGMCHERGIGTDKDEEKAFDLFVRSASKGFSVAQLNLGVCYEYGLGCKPDLTKSYLWYTLAAKSFRSDWPDELAPFKKKINLWGREMVISFGF